MNSAREKIIEASPSQRIVVFRSQDRETLSTLTSNTDGELDAPLKGVSRVTLHSAVIPKTWFNISSQIGNNVLTVRIGVAQYAVTFTDGNYDYDTFATHLQTRLQADANLGVWSVLKVNVANSYSSDSYRYAIRNTTQNWSIPSYTWTGQTTDVNKKAYRLLGLGASGLTGTANVYATTGVVNLCPIKFIMVHHGGTSDLVTTTSVPTYKFSFAIPCGNVSFGNFVTYSMKEGAYNSVRVPGVDFLMSDYRIRLTEPDGTLIDFNGADVEIAFLYEEQLRPQLREELNYNSTTGYRRRIVDNY